MNFLQRLAQGAQNLFSGLFRPQQQQVISPLPDNYDTGLVDQFGRPAPVPQVSTNDISIPEIARAEQSGGLTMTQPGTMPIQDTGSGGGGGGGDTHFQQLEKIIRDTGGNPKEIEEYNRLKAQMDAENAVNNIVAAVANPLQEEIASWWKRLDQYDKNNPFAFDEALARSSAQERLNPYYTATMNEFMTGIRRSSARSMEDTVRTVGELNVDASKLSDMERLNTQEAIRSSEEGFAGSGLFFSGKRERATGLEEVAGLQRQDEIQTNLSRGISSATRANSRLQEDLALQEARQKRLTEAERTTALEVDIAKQKRESALQRGLERLQFAGKIPGASPGDQLALENQFMSGLL